MQWEVIGKTRWDGTVCCLPPIALEIYDAKEVIAAKELLRFPGLDSITRYCRYDGFLLHPVVVIFACHPPHAGTIREEALP